MMILRRLLIPLLLLAYLMCWPFVLDKEEQREKERCWTESQAFTVLLLQLITLVGVSQIVKAKERIERKLKEGREKANSFNGWQLV